MKCYRMLTELREALAVGLGNRRGEGKHSRPRTPSRASTVLGPRASIRVRGQRSPTGVTPKAKQQKKALVKMKLKELSEDLQQRELFSEMMTNTLSWTMK